VRSAPKPKKIRVPREIKPIAPSVKRITPIPPSLDWPKAIQAALERVLAMAKRTGEPESITNKKVDAILNHRPQDGDVVVVDIGSEGKQIFQGIALRF
jgi:hypothetical protein